jgi:integrase
MSNSKHTEFELAFLPGDTPMFSTLILRLQADAALTETRRRDLISGLRRVAKALGRTPDEVPAHGMWLQPRLAKINAAALDLTTKAWQNAVSDARAALAHCGIVERRWSRITDLGPDWKPLWAIVLASKDPTLQAALCRFVYFLNHRGITPPEVRAEHALAYRDALIQNEIQKNPEVAFRAAVNGWNLAVKRLPSWPQTVLPLASRQKIIKLADTALPASFLADVERLMAGLSSPDPLAEDGRTRALRPATITQYRRQIIRFASELVHSGVPVGDLQTVAVMLNPAMAERGLRQMLSRTGNKTVKMISEVAALLRNLSKITNQPEEARKGLASLASRVAVAPQRGMTRKNRDRLRVVQNDKNIRRLLQLPDQLFAHPPAGKSNAFTKALAREDAVAIAILLMCPIRVKNLAEIHLENTLQRPGDGRVFLVLQEEEVKNDRTLEFELPRDLVRMIDRHLATRVPERCKAGNPWLFPRRDRIGSIEGSVLAARIAKRIRKLTGLEMNAHLFRHFAVMNWLDANPGGYEVARRLLGHSEVSHTINMYSGLEVTAATKSFADLMESKKGRRK